MDFLGPRSASILAEQRTLARPDSLQGNHCTACNTTTEVHCGITLHRVLKTGYQVVQLQHRRGERIERAVTLSAVITWRLMVMALLGRQTPELPA